MLIKLSEIIRAVSFRSFSESVFYCITTTSKLLSFFSNKWNGNRKLIKWLCWGMEKKVKVKQFFEAKNRKAVAVLLKNSWPEPENLFVVYEKCVCSPFREKNGDYWRALRKKRNRVHRTVSNGKTFSIALV